MNLKDNGIEVYPFVLPVHPKLEKVFGEQSHSLGLVVKDKCYMSEAKRIKARKNRKKHK